MSNSQSTAIPSGMPIGRALAIPAGIANDALREAVRAIDLVHGVGDLPRIPLRLASLGAAADDERIRRGKLALDRQGVQPVAILIEIDQDHQTFSAVHEIGHFLDLVGIGRPGAFASPADPACGEWRAIARRSLAIRQLISLRRTAADMSVRDHAADLLDLVEVWARSYAQYISVQSGNQVLLDSLRALRRWSPSEGIHYSQHWDDVDFAPIAGAIDRMLWRQGWQRPARL